MKGLWLIIRVACVLLQAVEIRSARNITIDDTSPLVQYGGKWGRSNANIFSHEGSHATNRDMNGSASFAFTGVGVYFLSPLFSIPIAVTLTLDGRPPEVVDLQTTVTLNIYESEASAARWGATGLDNVTHSLVVTYGKPLNNTPGPAPYTVVDGFIYTVEDRTSTSSADGNASNSSSTPLIAGLVCGLVSATLIAGILLFILWRRKQRNTSLGASSTNGTRPLGAVDPYVYPTTPVTMPAFPSTSSVKVSARAHSGAPPPPRVLPLSATSNSSSPTLATSTSAGNTTPFTKSSAAVTSSSSSFTAPTARMSTPMSPLAEGGFYTRDLAPPPAYDQ